MGFNNLLQLFVPQDRTFFPLFEKAGENLHKSSVTLIQMIDAAPHLRKGLIDEIEHLEHTGDNITHLILNELSKNFITPFDREDIHQLAVAIDDVLDFIHGAANRIELYNITEIPKPAAELAAIINRGCMELNVALRQLRSLKNVDAIKEACVKINSLENEADAVFDHAIAQLFEKEKDAVQLMKIKELYAALETATDKIEDATDVIQSILVKYA